MSKIGVGIGEDFPADDSNPASSEDDRGDRRCNDADYAARREAYRKWREQRRQWRRQWRDAWRARKQAFHQKTKDRIQERYGEDVAHHHNWGHAILWGGLALFAALVLFALISFLFAHIFVIAGVAALLALLAAYHRDVEAFDFPSHDYSHNAPPAEAAH